LIGGIFISDKNNYDFKIFVLRDIMLKKMMPLALLLFIISELFTNGMELLK